MKFIILLLFSFQHRFLINCQPHQLFIEYNRGEKCKFKEIDDKNNKYYLDTPTLFRVPESIIRFVFLSFENDSLYYTLWELIDKNCKELRIPKTEIFNHEDYVIFYYLILNR